MSKMWLEGLALPEAFTFPISRLGLTSDVHGEGPFVDTLPTRVDCYVHVGAMPPGCVSLEVLSAPLHRGTGAELNVVEAFKQQFSLALWLYSSSPSKIADHPTDRIGSAKWSLRGPDLEEFLRFARSLLDFHDDRQAYLVARRAPGLLEDEELRRLFVGWHSIDQDWLKRRWYLMAATDLYERAHNTRERDVKFLLLMMALEVIFTDGRENVIRLLKDRCARLNGRDATECKVIRKEVDNLYDRRSRLVHGDLFQESDTGFLAVTGADMINAIDIVRLSLVRLIALDQAKGLIVKSLDEGAIDQTAYEAVHARVDGFWAERGIDVQTLLRPSVFDHR